MHSSVNKCLAPKQVPYILHEIFAILMCAYFATLKFRDFAKILYFESL